MVSSSNPLEKVLAAPTFRGQPRICPHAAAQQAWDNRDT